MTANKVHGVSLGDEFQAADWNCFTVEEFITPKSMTDPWRAKIKLDNGQVATIDVTDLTHGPYRKVNE